MRPVRVGWQLPPKVIENQPSWRKRNHAIDAIFDVRGKRASVLLFGAAIALEVFVSRMASRRRERTKFKGMRLGTMKSGWKSLFNWILSSRTSPDTDDSSADYSSAAEQPYTDMRLMQSVEFIGGPLDGYRERFDLMSIETFLAVPVSRATLRWVARDWSARRDHSNLRHNEVTSVAIYEFSRGLAGDRYCFCLQVKPDHMETRK